MPVGAKLERKNAYMEKLIGLVENTPVALIVGVDHVGSKQMQNIRLALRGKCTILMGKNTMIRKAIRKRMDALLEEDENADVEPLTNLLTAVNGNMGFIFCQTPDGLDAARNAINEFVVPASAKAGTVAPRDVEIPAGPSGLEPSQTSFFQALNIATKIVKGAIEITTACKVCIEGEKVSLSAQALLTKMNIRPFEYGMKVLSAYQDGQVFAAEVLDIDDNVMVGKFLKGVSHVAAFGREVGIPTEAGLPHMFTKAFKNIVATITDFEFDAGKEANEIKAILSDPEALARMKAAAAGPATGGGNTGGGDAAPAAAAAAEEEEEDEMDFDLFG